MKAASQASVALSGETSADAAATPLKEERHRLRNALYEAFVAAFLLPSPGSEMQPPAATENVRVLPGEGRKAAEVPLLARPSSEHGDSEPEGWRTTLDEAFEKTGETFATVHDRQDAIEAVLKVYADLEREKGKGKAEIDKDLKRVRDLLKLD
jgi:hypothetical protein